MGNMSAFDILTPSNGNLMSEGGKIRICPSPLNGNTVDGTGGKSSLFTFGGPTGSKQVFMQNGYNEFTS